MDNTAQKRTNNGLSVEKDTSSAEEQSARVRKPTLLKLQWLAERLRKVERIKKQIADGTYHVDSRDVAKSMLNLK